MISATEIRALMSDRVEHTLFVIDTALRARLAGDDYYRMDTLPSIVVRYHKLNEEQITQVKARLYTEGYTCVVDREFSVFKVMWHRKVRTEQLPPKGYDHPGFY